ncbi:MAG TPA: LysM peptidoglycan-binding domain-containing protein [Kofleriaceae bacterium]|nr:LysM peptidoglycan-binding domain-containing protein [Kofleriaceae bacterium]
MKVVALVVAAAALVARAAPAVAQPSESAVTMHKVEKGDSLELLAAEYYGDRRHKIYIMIENRLDHARELKPGEKLRIPVSNDVTVAVGDTLQSLAGVYLGDERRAKYLAEFNRLDEGGSVSAGMSLSIPLRVTYRANGKEPLKAIAAALFRDDKKAALLKEYNFLRGDTLDKGQAITVPIYLRVQPSKQRPPDAESKALVLKRTEVLEQAKRVLPSARAAWKAGDYAAVKRELAELMKTFPYLDAEQAVDVGVLLGSAYVAFDDVDTARATFEQVLERSPKYSLSAYAHSPRVREVWLKAGGSVDETTRPEPGK